MNNNGYIYVLMNPSLQNMVKIGKTTRTPEERAKELSSNTGVPTPFVVVYSYLFEDCTLAENFVHTYLETKGYRVSSNREFFEIPINEAVDSVIKAKEHFGEFTKKTEIEDTSELNINETKNLVILYQNEIFPKINDISKELLDDTIINSIELIDFFINFELWNYTCVRISDLLILLDSKKILPHTYFDDFSRFCLNQPEEEIQNILTEECESIINQISMRIDHLPDEKEKFTVFMEFFKFALEIKEFNSVLALINDFSNFIKELTLKYNTHTENDIDTEDYTNPWDEAFDMGCNYFSGEQNYLQDYNEAEKWFNKATMLGSNLAYAYLIMIYRYGLGRRKDLNKAIDYSKKAIEKGYTQGYVTMSSIYVDLNHIDNAIKCWEIYINIFETNPPDEDYLSLCLDASFSEFLNELKNINKLTINKNILQIFADRIYNILINVIEGEENSSIKEKYIQAIKTNLYHYPLKFKNENEKNDSKIKSFLIQFLNNA